jgi:3-hydroxyacyl-[acyl-carrier-protein] dehydratase
MAGNEANGVSSLIPHKAPYLFIDRVKDYISGEGIECEMVIDGKEPYFTGHFPGRPILPGVFEVEAMFQAAEVFIALEREGKDGPVDKRAPHLAKIVSAKFQRPISPPGTFTVSANVNKVDGENIKFKGAIYSGDEKCAESSFIVRLL